MIDSSEEQKILIRHDDKDKIYLYTYRRCVESTVSYIYIHNIYIYIYIYILYITKIRACVCMYVYEWICIFEKCACVCVYAWDVKQEDYHSAPFKESTQAVAKIVLQPVVGLFFCEKVGRPWWNKFCSVRSLVFREINFPYRKIHG